MSGEAHTPWLRSGRMIYALQQDGFRKGEPNMVNRFTISVQAGHPHPGETEMEAVASLVQSAPDLLEALKRVLDHPLCRLDGSTEPLVRAAIARAEGRSNG